MYKEETLVHLLQRVGGVLLKLITRLYIYFDRLVIYIIPSGIVSSTPSHQEDVGRGHFEIILRFYYPMDEFQ